MVFGSLKYLLSNPKLPFIYQKSCEGQERSRRVTANPCLLPTLSPLQPWHSGPGCGGSLLREAPLLMKGKTDRRGRSSHKLQHLLFHLRVAVTSLNPVSLHPTHPHPIAHPHIPHPDPSFLSWAGQQYGTGLDILGPRDRQKNSWRCLPTFPLASSPPPPNFLNIWHRECTQQLFVKLKHL